MLVTEHGQKLERKWICRGKMEETIGEMKKAKQKNNVWSNMIAKLDKN